jgi:PAS domain S-box-containing protein
MEDREKTKEQSQNDLTELRTKITELEHIEANQEQTEKKLAKPKELHRLIAENTSDVITLQKFSLQATYTYVSPSIKDVSGYEPEELIGKSPFDFIHPDDKKKLYPILIKYINTKLKKIFTGKELPITNRIELRFKDKEGNWRYLQSTGNIVGNQLLFITRDITEHKRNERLQQVLYNISKAASSPITLDQLYPLIHKELGTIIDTTNFYIALVDEKEDKLYFPYYQDEKDDNFPILNFSTSNTLTTYVIKTGKPLLNDNSQYEEMVAQGILTAMGTITDESIWLGVPLKVEDKTIGTMVVQSYINSNLYSKSDIQLLEFVSSQVATAIERKLAEESLQKSQQEFASLFKSNSEALVYTDEKGTILDINLRFYELFGYSLEEIKGKNINCGIIHPPDKIIEGKDLDNKALSKGCIRFETIRKKKDGTLFPVSISGSPVIVDGQPRGIIGTFIDIIERKTIEEKLQKLAHFDALTGCYSRGYGLNLLEQKIKTANRKKTPILLLYR